MHIVAKLAGGIRLIRIMAKPTLESKSTAASTPFRCGMTIVEASSPFIQAVLRLSG